MTLWCLGPLELQSKKTAETKRQVVYTLVYRNKLIYREVLFMEFNNNLNSKYFGVKANPVNPKYIELDTNMQKGYKYYMKEDYTETINVWCNVFNDIMDAMKNESIKTFTQFDKIYNGTQFVSNWANDFDDCLCYVVSNVHDEDALESYGEIRIGLNEKIKEFIEKDDNLSFENAIRAIAETHFYMGNSKKGEEIFENYLRLNVEWGWGWIGWSDQYWLCKGERADYKRAEEILLKALSVPNLKDRDSVQERLLDLYSESEQKEKFKNLDKKLKQDSINHKESKEQLSLNMKKGNSNYSNQAISQKVGRNEPCPCGSGKKFKKCCGLN